MKVFLRDIPYDGLVVKQSVSAAELDLQSEDFLCLGPLQLDVRFDKADQDLLAHVQAQGAYEMSCARCLEPVRQDRQDEFDLVFEISPKAEFIEYGEEIRQELLILLSQVVRCQDNCRGLCSQCGVNLNKQKCSCIIPDPAEHKKINIKLK